MKWINSVYSFFTKPVASVPLGIFRILIAAFAIVQAILWYEDWLAFFGREGWIQWEISQALNQQWSVHIEQVYNLLHNAFNLNENQSVWTFYWIYLFSLTGLLLGLYTRFFAALALLCHYIIMSSIPTFIYGVDIFLQIALFYLMVMPVAKAVSLDVFFGRVSTTTEWSVTLSLRVLQIHLSLAYLSAGYEKLLAPDWWNGNVLWRALVQPDFNQFNLTWLASYPIICIVLSWFTMIVETFYCVALWIPKLRVAWLGAIIALHLGIGLFLGLWLFGIIMIFLSISAFGYNAHLDIIKYYKRRKPLAMTEHEQFISEPVLSKA